MLAPYASCPDHSRGRLYPEPESATRDAFQRDRDRIIHSEAFRRLEYKTQVFVNQEEARYRTRLTHSLEVAQIARSLARSLHLNEDLTEALALAHDLGHPPFGHAGEEALNACMREFGGFDHNAQSIRLLTHLERRYPDFAGLNLSWEVLEGVAKHNGPVVDPPRALAEYQARHDLQLGEWAGPEAQAAAIADDIAYCNHDIEDGVRAGLLDLPLLESVPELAATLAEIRNAYPSIEDGVALCEMIRRRIGRMIGDVLETSWARLAAAGVKTPEDIRTHSGPLIGFSEQMDDYRCRIKAFLMQHMYSHERVLMRARKGQRIIRELFIRLYEQMEGETLPQQRAVAACDAVACMTDRDAVRVFRS